MIRPSQRTLEHRKKFAEISTAGRCNRQTFGSRNVRRPPAAIGPFYRVAPVASARRSGQNTRSPVDSPATAASVAAGFHH
jgi:hypothetical protein